MPKSKSRFIPIAKEASRSINVLRISKRSMSGVSESQPWIREVMLSKIMTSYTFFPIISNNALKFSEILASSYAENFLSFLGRRKLKVLGIEVETGKFAKVSDWKG